jgi:hypothetical protein
MAWTAIYPWPAQHTHDHRVVLAAAADCGMGEPMNAEQDAVSAEARRDYVLAEFRCALIRAKLAQLDIEAAAVALKYKIVTPEQALVMFWESEGVQFLGLELKGSA